MQIRTQPPVLDDVRDYRLENSVERPVVKPPMECGLNKSASLCSGFTFKYNAESVLDCGTKVYV